MSEKTEQHHPFSARLVPTAVLDTAVAEARQHLKWVPHGTPLTIGTIKTQGGFFIQDGGEYQFSFAINRGLQLGHAHNANGMRLGSTRPVRYSDLHPDQRALVVHVLAGGEIPNQQVVHRGQIAGGPYGFCDWFWTQASEWRLICERHDPRDVALEAIDFAGRLNSCDRISLLKLVTWSAFFQDRPFHLSVIEGLLEQGAQFLDESPLRLALYDCATAKRPVWAELALSVERTFGLGFERWGDQDFEQEFLKRFRTEYRDGIEIECAGPHARVEYRFLCPELCRTRCRFDVSDVSQQRPFMSALERISRTQFPGRRLTAIEEDQPVSPQASAEPVASRRAALKERVDFPATETELKKVGHECPPVVWNYDAAKDFVLEHAPVIIPLRFLLGRRHSRRQRIEIIAANLMWEDTAWRGSLEAWQIALLQRCFGLVLEQNREQRWIYRAKGWNWFSEPRSLRATHRLEELWDYEYEVRWDLEQCRMALREVYRHRQREKPLATRTARTLGDRIRELRKTCDSLSRNFRAALIQEAALIRRIAWPESTPEEVEQDYRDASPELWLASMENIAAQFFPTWYIEERVRSAESLFKEAVAVVKESPATHISGTGLIQQRLVLSGWGDEGVASSLYSPPKRWREVTADRPPSVPKREY